MENYSILEDYSVNWSQKLGTGINGPVRPCTKLSTGERFALKVLLDKPKSQTEVNLHVQCSGHANIVTVYDVYANDVQFPGEEYPRPRLLMVMELMDGGELFDRISQKRGFTEKQAAMYARQIAFGIQRCHMLNIAHRDIKPENLLLKDNSEDSPVKLTDFGFAKVDDGNLVTPHYTPYYVSPQVLEAQRQQRREQRGIIPTTTQYTYDKSCDMWSLGVVLYIMMCGYPPFYSETPSKTITKDMKRRIMAGEYEFPSDEWNIISRQAKDIIKGLLCVVASERMNIEEFLSHPWLQLSTTLPNMQLHSPSLLLDKNSFEAAKEAHSRHLTELRLPETKLTLKPLAIVDNPIMRKRRIQNNESLDNRHLVEPPEKRRTKNELGITCLRDVIAHCILPPRDESGDDSRLCLSVQIACQNNNDDQLLQRLLHRLHWNGEIFTQKVDRSKLAEALAKLVESRTRPPSEEYLKT
ncbi:MAP kinase-activated protein kinase 5-like [Saccoglossus kowalevskii]